MPKTKDGGFLLDDSPVVDYTEELEKLIEERDKDLPPSYYRGQDKKTKPKKDKGGYIIPG